MSSVNYDLNTKGVRLLDAKEAWVQGKNGKRVLNPNYKFVGKIDTTMSNFVISAGDKTKPKYIADICDLNKTAKSEIINHFYDENGKRNKKYVAYFVVKKKEIKAKKT